MKKLTQALLITLLLSNLLLLGKLTLSDAQAEGTAPTTVCHSFGVRGDIITRNFEGHTDPGDEAVALPAGWQPVGGYSSTSSGYVIACKTTP